METAAAGQRVRGRAQVKINGLLAKGESSRRAVEGLNNKIRVVTGRPYDLRTYQAMELVLQHTRGKLPEPRDYPQTLLTKLNYFL